MDFIPHISSLLTATWNGWWMLGLLLSAIISEVVQPGAVTNASSSVTTMANRTYHLAPHNFFGQLFISIFRIGTFTMALCMSFYTTGVFKFRNYMLIFGVALAFILVKMLLNKILEFAFSLHRRNEAAYEHYANLYTVTMLVFYPCELVLIHWYNVVVNRWVFGILLALSGLAWVVRCCRMYITKPADIFYVLLYNMTLEALPLCGVVYITSKLI